MITETNTTKIVLSPDASLFGNELARVLSPSSPLQSEEFLKGRTKQLELIHQSLMAKGRHVLIHGFRGVGKTSLAQTAAYKLQEGGEEPIIVGCDGTSTLFTIVLDIVNEVTSKNPTLLSEESNSDAKISIPWLSIGTGKKSNYGHVEPPKTISACVRYVEYLSRTYKSTPIIVVDEFDQITDTLEQKNFTNFIKQISDRHVDAKIIVCGIGDSIDTLMAAHQSADRYFQTIKLERLEWSARCEIIDNAASHLGITVDESTKLRIAKISDGFPHYVHLITEKLFWCVYHDEDDGVALAKDFINGMQNASDAMEMKLKAPYEEATRKYTNDYEYILFAVADTHELVRSSTDIYKNSYLRIMKNKGNEPLNRTKFNARMNNLKKKNYSNILTGTRAGWYEFTEKVLRGYARLRAEQIGVELEPDHPLAKKLNRNF